MGKVMVNKGEVLFFFSEINRIGVIKEANRPHRELAELK